MDIIGLIPAGGLANRMGRLPCSKEVFPLTGGNGTMRVISSNLIDYFKTAGIKTVFFILRKGKWDIPEYFGDGSLDGIHAGYLIANLPFGTPFTADQAFPFITDKIVAFGFPDLLIYPDDAFANMKSAFLAGKSDILLGVAPTDAYLKSDMLELDDQGKISNIVIKQNRPDLKYSWFGAFWRPSFTAYLHDFLTSFIITNPDGNFMSHDGDRRELYMGDIIMSAIGKGLTVDYVLFPEGHYTDLGTPDVFSNNLNL